MTMKELAIDETLRNELVAALTGLLANAPKPKGIKQDFSYILYMEASRTILAKLKEINPNCPLEEKK